MPVATSSGLLDQLAAEAVESLAPDTSRPPCRVDPAGEGRSTAGMLTVAGIPTFEIARMMGASIEQIEKTYGHLLPDALDRGRAALEAFDSHRAESFGH